METDTLAAVLQDTPALVVRPESAGSNTRVQSEAEDWRVPCRLSPAARLRADTRLDVRAFSTDPGLGSCLAAAICTARGADRDASA